MARGLAQKRKCGDMGTGRAARSRANASKFGRGSVLDRIHHLFVQKLQHALAELLEDSQTRNGLPPSSVGLQHNMPKLRCFLQGLLTVSRSVELMIQQKNPFSFGSVASGCYHIRRGMEKKG